MYAINVSWEQSNEVLRWAIEERAQLRLTVRLAREWVEVASQFLGGEMLNTLTIRKAPSPWTERMLAGQLLPCSFRKGHKKYLFVSGVLSETTVKIDSKDEPAYVLAWPEGLQQVQRRFYFRAAVPDGIDLAVRIWLAVPAISTAPMDPPLAEGRLIDLSAGGAQLDMPDANALDVDRSYLMELELPKPENPALVLAQVRRTDPIPESSRQCYGVQFLSLDQSPRGRETLMCLARVANYFRSLQTPVNVNSQPPSEQSTR